MSIISHTKSKDADGYATGLSDPLVYLSAPSDVVSTFLLQIKGADWHLCLRAAPSIHTEKKKQ